MYTCLFSDLHVSLPFDKFTMGVLRALNVAPTHIHPNTWASLQAFRLLCDVMRLHPTPSSFLSYHSVSSEAGVWPPPFAVINVSPFPFVFKKNFHKLKVSVFIYKWLLAIS